MKKYQQPKCSDECFAACMSDVLFDTKRNAWECKNKNGGSSKEEKRSCVKDRYPLSVSQAHFCWDIFYSSIQPKGLSVLFMISSFTLDHMPIPSFILFFSLHMYYFLVNSQFCFFCLLPGTLKCFPFMWESIFCSFSQSLFQCYE